MPTLGIIGGIGPESTGEYYRQLIAEYRRRIQHCEPVGAFVNEQVATTNFLFCHEDEKTGVEMGKRLGNTFNYLATQLISTREVFSSPSYQSLGLLPALRRAATGPDANENPTWQTLAEASPKPLLPVDPGSPASPRELGEISAVWYPSLRRWILAGSIQCVINVARKPWGPWTTSDAICDPGRPDRDAGFSTVSFSNVPVTYAPYLIRR